MQNLTRLAATCGLAFIVSAAPGDASACTRTLFVGQDDLVITGRTLDWEEDMASDLWIFPAGMERNGASDRDPITWTSTYGSVIVSSYNIGSADGMNERGLVANVLYLAESEYGPPVEGRPNLSIAAWGQYVLDNFATVAEAVDALRAEPFNLIAPTLPNGAAATLHLSISDASGDSAIFEYVDGALIIHHDRAHVVMTNSPTFDKQLAIDAYWTDVGGLNFLPGTSRASDRFARASFLLGTIPAGVDPNYIASVPDESHAFQAVASVMSVERAVSVPLGTSTPGQPNIASTIWRTVSDQKNLVYYFDSSTRPNTFWVSFEKVDFSVGAPVRKLTIQHGEVFAGETADDFEDAEAFAFLPAKVE